MKPLEPAVKLAADAIYNSDPAKYRRLIIWIRQAEQAKFTAPVIAEALRRFLPYAQVNPWWPYLDTVIYKAAKDLAAAEHDARHAEYKQDRTAAEILRALGMVGVVK